jgi:hypothetical protein
MAKLVNTNKIFDLPVGATLRVGNNRTVSRIDGATFAGQLHGHAVFRVTVDMTGGPGATITLDPCGYLTPTTRSAMIDFARAFGVRLSLSIARGVLSGRCGTNELAWNADGDASVYAERYTA